MLFAPLRWFYLARNQCGYRIVGREVTVFGTQITLNQYSHDEGTKAVRATSIESYGKRNANEQQHYVKIGMDKHEQDSIIILYCTRLHP